MSPKYAIWVLFSYYCFNNMLGHIPYEIMLELCVLARNMSWPDGLVLIWLWQGVGLNLSGLKFSFLFAKKLVWLEYERGRDNPSRRGSQKILFLPPTTLRDSLKGKI